MRRSKSGTVATIVVVLASAAHSDVFQGGAVSAHAGQAAAKSVIPQENLKIPESMRACAASLQKIHAAINAYEKDRGDLPSWLSDLVSDYLSKEILLCPDNADRTEAPYHPDPKLSCSHTYEFSPQSRDWKERQVRGFGNVVPIVRCIDHGPEMVLNLSVGGQIYWSALGWEQMFAPTSRAGRLKLTGAVRDDGGKPVAGAKLTVLLLSRSEVTSDSQGNFVLNLEPADIPGMQPVHYIVARHEQRNLPTAVAVYQETKTVDVNLTPGVLKSKPFQMGTDTSYWQPRMDMDKAL